MNKKFKFIVTAVLITILFTACSGRQSAVNSNEITVVASFYPIYIIAENVIGDTEGIDLENMAPPQTGCLHDYQLSTGDMKKLSQADIFIINGGGMESFIDKALSLYPNLNILDSSQGVTKLEDVNSENNNPEEEHEENSHFWILPNNAAIQAKNICSALCDISPANADIFRKNTDTFISSLSNIPQFDGSNIKACVFNEAFEYFELSYGMVIPACVEMDENQIPTAKELADIIKTVKDENIKLLIAADDAGIDVAETIARETDASVIKLDPVLTGDFSPDSYVKAMIDNTNKIKEAVNGGDLK